MASNYLAKGLKRSALTVALGLCFAGGVQAQSTTGGINGSAPAGSTVTVTNNSGFTRTVSVDANGRYNINNLPVGTYTVTSGGEKREVVVTVGSSAAASFGGATTLGTVTVTGTTIAPIDTTTLDTRSVITSQQLQRLPLARSAEAIALLAPGAVNGAAGFFGGLVSFGGSGVSENAYYVNGYFTGEPVSNLGGFTLPYQAIEQQETFLGGYSAKYGRSDGGVINQIGKRGTNDWHFGGQVTYTPKSLRSTPDDLYFPNISLPSGYNYQNTTQPGQLYQRGKDNKTWSHSYTAYASGPIIKDRLFFFALGEWNRSETTSAPNALSSSPRLTDNTTKNPKLYGKLDWSITDNHFLEYTYLSDKSDRNGEFYAYNFSNGSIGSKLSVVPDPFYQKNEFNILKYTGYLTDTLTLSALYGESTLHKRQINPSIIPGVPLLGGVSNQNPAITGGTPITNNQSGAVGINAKDKSKGMRVDLEWVLGRHTLTAGIDNIKFEAFNEGQDQLVDRWIYGRTTGNIVPGHVGSPASPSNPNGYYAYRLIFKTATSMSLDQKAYYLEDRWQLTDNFLLSLGIRNDKFVNRNNVGEAYLDAKNQWAPRIGFSWDVNGDASMKVFGNAGRYFLALPNNVAIRGASASTFTREYFTYTGISSNGTPTGLTPVPRTDGGSGPYSSNGEYGTPVDVRAFAPSDLKNMYQDEYILGMEKMLTSDWMLGLKLTHRSLKSAVDDFCDPYALMDAAGYTPVASNNGKIIAQKGSSLVEVAYCYMFNPGGSNTYSFANVDSSYNPTGSRTDIKISSAQLGFDQGVKRTYAALDLYLERPWDGKWEARIDYTFSKSRGNTEGQVKSEFGQTNISKTQDWDAAALMRYSYGYLANDRRHQLKMRGSYAITDEWLVSGNIRIVSGAPISCLGYFNPGNINENDPAADPVGYGSSYHTCFGQVATPGSQRTPWTKTLDFGVTYRPNYFDKKLALGLNVRNLTNEKKPLQVDVTSETAPYTVSNTYLLPIANQTPRTVMFTASYDW
ncbi:MAG: TonB-dependent receptor domain-containing protein [Thermomonas haemolytica]